jgi:hypothetical protein
MDKVRRSIIRGGADDSDGEEFGKLMRGYLLQILAILRNLEDYSFRSARIFSSRAYASSSENGIVEIFASLLYVANPVLKNTYVNGSFTRTAPFELKGVYIGLSHVVALSDPYLKFIVGFMTRTRFTLCHKGTHITMGSSSKTSAFQVAASVCTLNDLSTLMARPLGSQVGHFMSCIGGHL